MRTKRTKEINKACVEHGMVYGDFKDLRRTTASYRVLRVIALRI